MTFPFAARTNAPNTRAASMEPLEVLLSTHNPQVDKLLGGGFPCKGFVELLTTGERRGEISLLIHALTHVKRVVWILPPQGFTPYAPAFEAAGIDLSRQLFVVPASPEEAFRCAEAAVTSGEADAVVAWLAPLARDEDRRAVSRLALACTSRNVVLFGIRPASLACLPLTADLRVQFSPVHKGPEILSRIRTLRRRTFINASASAEIPLLRKLLNLQSLVTANQLLCSTAFSLNLSLLSSSASTSSTVVRTN